MLTKIQYQDEAERQQIIEANSSLILIEEQNITEGNFLIFSDTPRIEDNIQEIRINTDLILLKQEGII